MGSIRKCLFVLIRVSLYFGFWMDVVRLEFGFLNVA